MDVGNASPAGDKGADDLRQGGVNILGAVSLADDHIFETEFLEGGTCDEEYFVDEWLGDDLRVLLPVRVTFPIPNLDGEHRRPLFVPHLYLFARILHQEN